MLEKLGADFTNEEEGELKKICTMREVLDEDLVCKDSRTSSKLNKIGAFNVWQDVISLIVKENLLKELANTGRIGVVLYVVIKLIKSVFAAGKED